MWILICFVLYIIIGIIYNNKKDSKNGFEAKKNELYGPVNTNMLCPHCQNNGCVRTKKVETKVGVSGGKATAAILTGGLSLIAVGLSRKEDKTNAYCDNCNNTWFF